NEAVLISVVGKQTMAHCGNGKMIVSPSHGNAVVSFVWQPLVEKWPAASPSTFPSDDLLQQPPHVN
ncbi:hypothetical protein A2U01_0049703, partial [Trifolium medium]|nr:hypothetical protein [Trifolium medium]